MAKEKKRGFFSWLGFGKEEETQQPAEEQQQPTDAAQQPIAEESALASAEAQAEETVAVTEHVAEEQLAPPEAVVAKPITTIEEEVLPEEEIHPDVAPIEEEPQAEELIIDVPAEPVVVPQAPVIEVTPAEPVVVPQAPSIEVAPAEPVAVPHEPVIEVAPAEPLVVPQAPVIEVAPAEPVVVPQAPVIEVTPAEPVTVPHEPIIEDATVELEDDALSDEELEALALAETYAEDAEAEAQDTVSDLPLAAAPIVTQEQERPTKEGFFARLKRSLVKTRENLGSGFISLFRGKKIDDDLFEELEEQLLIADVGVETTRRIITNLTQQANRKQLRDAEALYGLLKAEMAGILDKVDQPLDVGGKAPFVILMVGVNGVGKTTTIGKLARQYQAQGKSVMLAAGDTFRAAAVEQLQVWGQRNNIPVVAQHTGADSASVIFDAIQAAKSRNVDVLIADTAGRLQNKAHLMEELKKITRVMKKLDGDAPHEVMLTLDASTGQNAVSQAKLFHEAVGLTGITLTKLDGTAKGGVIFSVADQFGIPIRYIGVGEGIEDLRPFKAADFIEALFAREE
ncbi:signal recognition particle-docking protein FtsY [Pantoea rodasii]|uniref:Signal recognition particle receptor FtsY n=1 Tax=Pantoea rodasii TaxID=1076549 RepID=A0A2M9W4E4_9GAMM|nr:signal recognition particle-docking protein FtsY [Pantoea rodasii]ORM64815.1 signal recognition particle-docking protein FtsY [Pantoea rodasii]PJZ02385.1 signal recognition particle-docking protein FtsY [Pantoea rodasii]